MNSTNGSVRIGPISLFTLVIILCLAVMAVLSATTAQATYSAAEKQALFTNDTYQNEQAAQSAVAVIDAAIPKKFREKDGSHPARRTFQGLRIAVNDELGSVDRMVREAVPRLNPGGRLAVISFHSLEDRIVKNALAAFAKGCTCPPDFPVCVCGKKPQVKLVNKKPIVSGAAELEENPRARSAKLRVAEKL